MKEYKFIPPTKFKILNWIINTILIFFIILSMIIFDNIVEKSMSLCVFLLYNGLLSINRKWYSLCHRDDESYNVKYVWIIFLILGFLLLICDIIYFIL